MGATAIASVASFSVVLGETFAAVGLSTVVPNLFIAAAKAAKGAVAPPADVASAVAMLTDAQAKLSAATPGTADVTAAKAGVDSALSLLAVPNPNAAGNQKAQASFQDMFGAESAAKGVVSKALDVVKNAANAVDELHVLLPNKATIDAEFEFHASEEYKAGVGIGAAVEMVTVKAGYSGMYESSSRNKVTLHVEFGAIAVKI